MCNGVQLFCENNNIGGGADESGGGGGPAPNYWWKPYDGVVPNPVALCGPTAGDDADVCCIQSCGTGLGCCYSKQFNELPGTHPNANALRHVCVGQNFPAPVDPIVDWAWVSSLRNT